MSGSWNPEVSPGIGLFFIPLAGLVELLCYCMSRWYTYRLYDAHFMEDLLNNSEYTDDPESKESASEQDSVLLSMEDKKNRGLTGSLTPSSPLTSD